MHARSASPTAYAQTTTVKRIYSTTRHSVSPRNTTKTTTNNNNDNNNNINTSPASCYGRGLRNPDTIRVHAKSTQPRGPHRARLFKKKNGEQHRRVGRAPHLCMLEIMSSRARATPDRYGSRITADAVSSRALTASETCSLHRASNVAISACGKPATTHQDTTSRPAATKQQQPADMFFFDLYRVVTDEKTLRRGFDLQR